MKINIPTLTRPCVFSPTGVLQLPVPGGGVWHVTASVKTPGDVPGDVPDGICAVTLDLAGHMEVVVGGVTYWRIPTNQRAEADQVDLWPLGELMTNFRCEDESDPPLVISTLNWSFHLAQGATP